MTAKVEQSASSAAELFIGSQATITMRDTLGETIHVVVVQTTDMARDSMGSGTAIAGATTNIASFVEETHITMATTNLMTGN